MAATGNKVDNAGRAPAGWFRPGAAACLLGIALAGGLAIIATRAPASAAVRYKSTGAATLGGADALAGLPRACEDYADRVWVSVESHGDCIAFYPSGKVAAAKVAVLYFEGDVPASYRRNREKLAGHLAGMLALMRKLAEVHKVPYVLVARPGTFGSTGSHADRRKVREYLVMNAAVDAIRARLGLDRIALAGQSGGATIAAALLTLGRSDVLCAAPASGGYDLAAMLDWHARRLGVEETHREKPAVMAGRFNVMDRIVDIRPDAGRRIFVVGDAEDQVTPFAQQRRFAELLKAAGHHAELVEARGQGAERHGLSVTALRLAGMCAAGASDQDIRRAARP